MDNKENELSNEQLDHIADFTQKLDFNKEHERTILPQDAAERHKFIEELKARRKANLEKSQ